MWFRGILNPNIWRVSPGLAWVAPKERFDSSMARLWFESTALHKMLYQPSSRLSGLVSDCTGISVKGLGLALTCFSDVGRDGMDASMPLHGVRENKKSVGTTIVPIIWSKHSASKGLRMAFTSQVQVLITPLILVR